MSAVILLPLLLAATAAANVFVSSSAGNDSNSGATPAAPLKTLPRAAALIRAQGLPPGAGLYLLRGDVFPLPTALFLTGLLGTPDSPVTVGGYGPLARRPVLSRLPGQAAGPTLTIDNSSHVAVTGLEVRGGENGVAFTFDVLGPTRGAFSGLTVTDCFFNSIGGLHYNASSGSWWGAAVALAAAHSGVVVKGVNISHNIVNGSDVFYSNSVPYAGWTRAFVEQLVIDGNAVTKNSFNVVFLDTTAFVSVTRNVFLGNKPTRLFVAGTTDVIMGTVNGSVQLVGNEFTGRGEYEPGGPDGCAIDFETNATGVLFQDNYVSRSWGAGIMVFGHVDNSNTRLSILNNTMLHNGCGQTRDDHGGIAFMRKGSSGALKGNVFATCPGTALFNDANDPGLAGWDISNNAVDGVNASLSFTATPVVSGEMLPSGGMLVTASCATSGAVLRYTVDGSRPREDASVFLEGGLELPPQWRAVAVFVKAFSGVGGVESEVAGGVFAPPAE